MKCPECKSKTKVKNVRQKNFYYRERICTSCDNKFITYEITKEKYKELQKLEKKINKQNTTILKLKRKIWGLKKYIPSKTYEKIMNRF